MVPDLEIEPWAILEKCRKFIRGKHSIIPFGPQTLIDEIDAVLSRKPAAPAVQPAQGELTREELMTLLHDSEAIGPVKGVETTFAFEPNVLLTKLNALLRNRMPAAPSPAANAEEVARKIIQAEPSVEAIAALLESFRAETLVEMGKRLESKLPCGHRSAYEVGDEGGTPYCQVCEARAETLARARQVIDEEIIMRETGKDAHGNKLVDGYMRPLNELAEAIGNLQSDPTWLARQLGEARAETLEQAAQCVTLQIASLSEHTYRPDYETMEQFHKRVLPNFVALEKSIRALSPDPNWLARQIAEAKLEEAKWWLDYHEINAGHRCLPTDCGPQRLAEIERTLAATKGTK